MLLVYWSARMTDNGLAVEPVEVHLHISGGFLLTVRRAACPELDDAARRARRPSRAEDYILYRVLDALTDAIYPVIDHLEARIDALEAAVLDATDQPPARPDLPAQAGGAAAPAPARRRSATTSRAATDGDRRAARASSAARASTCATSATTSSRSRASSSRQTDDLTTLTSTYFNANANRLNPLRRGSR